MEKLAILGGTPVIQKDAPEALFKWPIITEEYEAAALDVVRNNKYSGTDITLQFQEEFAAWQGTEYALAFNNGTLSLEAAMFAIGLGAGDEIICPTKTYWASVVAATGFGASAVFCNITDMLTIDPTDLERCLSPRTKAIMVVHYFGYPCDMDAIMAFAKKHNLLVIEDVSHAQGGLYKGKKLGTFGDVAAMSLMSWKSFAAGEMGMMVTNNRRYYERAIAYAHYERNNEKNIWESDELKPYFNIPLGGVKGRVNQICPAIGRVQLKYYDERTAELRRAMNYFFDQLEGVPGIKPIRANEAEGSTSAGFYSPHMAYYPEELGGLSVRRFCEAVNAELNGRFKSWDGGNYCLHTHAFFQTYDPIHLGKPGRIAFAERDLREDDKYLKPSEEKYCFSVPWFIQCMPEEIDLYAAAYRKVAENYAQLLDSDKDEAQGGRWHGKENE